MEIFANNVQDRDALHTVVVKELRDYGIKYQKQRKRQHGQEKNGKKRIFQTPLHQLELVDVFLVRGSIVQVPRFVSDACQRILEQVTTEGLFRKAGSTARQKTIRSSLESGKSLEKSYHVVDVANLLKTFFRDLPEPLLASGSVQESMLRSLLKGDKKIDILMMTCLLLPPLTLNILAFFMQFLHTVSLHSDQNRMTIENLAIIFAPSLMPLQEMHPTRLTNHVKIVELLIGNSDQIGMVPQRFLGGNLQNQANEVTEEKKRKKRRSGSLTRVFNGLKKIVGVRGSADDLDKSLEMSVGATPCLTKSTKKRKGDQATGMSAKKKKQIMALLPNGSLLPQTPMLVKENKKLRLSFGTSRRMPKQETIIESHMELPQLERRWSVVGTPIKEKRSGEFDGNNTKYFSPVVSLPCLNFSELSTELKPPAEFHEVATCTEPDDDDDEKDYVKVSKSDFQAFNERMEALEARMSQEFTNPDRVQDVYEQTLEQTDDLAHRLSRDLKIRRSGERRIIRSPSARKIGTIRRRSRESAAKITRTKSWHIGSSDMNIDLSFYPKGSLKRGRPNTVQTGLRLPSPVPKKPQETQTNQNDDEDDGEMWTSAEEFFLTQPQEEKIVFITEKTKEISSAQERRESLRSAVKPPEEPEEGPRFKTRISVNNTPMLPPKGIPRIRHKTPFEPPPPLPPTGRASIARLRSQNAGMVAAKAKLFDGLTTDSQSRWAGMENATTPKRVGVGPKKFRLQDTSSSRVLKAVNSEEADGFLKPVIKPDLLDFTPTRLVKVPRHSPVKTPMKAFRLNSRTSPRVPRNYRSPRH
ncbi:uncharacterized protein DMENIID0001_165280 [Sergentomyia squamirostris]